MTDTVIWKLIWYFLEICFTVWVILNKVIMIRKKYNIDVQILYCENIYKFCFLYFGSYWLLSTNNQRFQYKISLQFRSTIRINMSWNIVNKNNIIDLHINFSLTIYSYTKNKNNESSLSSISVSINKRSKVFLNNTTK